MLKVKLLVTYLGEDRSSDYKTQYMYVHQGAFRVGLMPKIFGVPIQFLQHTGVQLEFSAYSKLCTFITTCMAP